MNSFTISLLFLVGNLLIVGVHSSSIIPEGPMTDQERKDWEHMQKLLDIEMQKAREKYSKKPGCDAEEKPVQAEMLRPTSGDSFEEVYRKHMCDMCNGVAVQLEKGMVSGDKRKKYGGSLSEDDVIELAQKICSKKVDSNQELCKELIEQHHEMLQDRYREGPGYGLAEKICHSRCQPPEKASPKDTGDVKGNGDVSRKDDVKRQDDLEEKDEGKENADVSRKDDANTKDEGKKKEEVYKKDEVSKKIEGKKKDGVNKKDESKKKDDVNKKDDVSKKDDVNKKEDKDGVKEKKKAKKKDEL
ncbi:structural maintenance of chromosomes protein 4-like [Physella acuta]|uniref:structural maintenance of chromosomes protein 4-like n=1 Tax=Physella acuta TaxID=109671 RepID=UPI0027DAEAA3|nr:structural maintenance of chromosomes protein 4-like [Physella acuta]